MKLLKCESCGSQELTDHGTYTICDFCRSRFVNPAEKNSENSSTIGLASDIENLLRKCQEDPANRMRYASLILDLDPTNRQAQKYLFD